MTRALVVVLDGLVAGTLTQSSGGALEFAYDASYVSGRNVTPLSLSMPTAARRYRGRVVRAYLDGLLPDNEAIRHAWARQYQVSGRNPFALLEHVGDQVAGAVQFIREDDAGSLGQGGHRRLATREIARWIRELRLDPGAPLPDLEGGQFSLAGAKAKFGLLRLADGTWALPTGATPTTHIVKPAAGQFTGQELNEHVCLELAQAVDLYAAGTAYRRFGSEEAIVSTRYDRLPLGDDVWRRVHQEDLCQALGVPPDKKYQRHDGGPGVRRIASGLHQALPPRVATGVLERFAAGLLFNWLVGGTDAHAKNYSLLLSGEDVRLAPLYDITSWLPYRSTSPQLGRRPGAGDNAKLTMAMSINGKYEGLSLTDQDWRAAAGELGLEPDWLVDRGLAIAQDLALAVPSVVSRVRAAHAKTLSVDQSTMLDALKVTVGQHVEVCHGILLGRPARASRRRFPEEQAVRTTGA